MCGFAQTIVNMRKNVITIIVLVGFIVIVSIVALKLYDDNRMFSIIGWIATIVLGSLGIYVSFNSKSNIIVKLEKQIKDKEKRIEDKDVQIKLLEELREYEKNSNLYKEKELSEKIAKVREEKNKICREKDELKKQLEQVKYYREKKIETQSPIYRKACNLLRKGDVEKALNVLSAEKLEKYSDIDLWLFKAELLLRIGNCDKAIECYQKAIELKHDYAVAYNNMGITHGEKGNYDKAIECCQKAIELKPDDAEAYHNMGITHHKKGNYDKAIECYPKAIELKPDDANAYNNMGIAYQYLGNETKANDCFQKASMIRHNISFTEFGGSLF